MKLFHNVDAEKCLQEGYRSIGRWVANRQQRATKHQIFFEDRKTKESNKAMSALEPKIHTCEIRSINADTSLETLDLSENQLTDDSLAHLAGLKNLKWLNLWRTGISDAGVARAVLTDNEHFDSHSPGSLGVLIDQILVSVQYVTRG